MNHALTLLDSAAEQWSTVITRATLEGGVALLLAWFLSALLPRVSGSLRCWFWRLAFLKLLASLVVWQPIGIPLLRPVPTPLPEAQTTIGVTVSQRTAQFFADPEPKVVGPTLLVFPPGLRVENLSPPTRLTPGAGLFLLWALGLLACGLRTFLQWRRCLRFRQRCVEARDPSLAASLRDLCRALRLRRAPVLLLDEELGPLLIGGRLPAIVLPATLALSASAAELRMILAHELAHWRRRDFLWNWLFLPVQACFFFHPLVWLRQRQYRLAQEAACDEEAVRVTAAPAREYAELLVKVATQNRHLSNKQLADLLPMAGSAARQLEGIQLQEEKTLETVRRVALRERDALAAGHNSSAQEQANAITMREATKRRRTETEASIVEGAVSRLARLLTPAQAEWAFLLEQGVTPERESPEPALLDPVAGFVVGPQTDQFGHAALSPGGPPVGAAGVNGANGGPDPSGELLSAQERLTRMQDATSRGMIFLSSPFTKAIAMRAGGGAGVGGGEAVLTLVPPPGADLVIGTQIGPAGAGTPGPGAIVRQPLNTDAARQQMAQEMQSLSTEVSDLRRQLFNPDGSVDPAEYETLLRPLAHRLFLSPRFQAALEKRLHVKR